MNLVLCNRDADRDHDLIVGEHLPVEKQATKW
jgi:hypothetical protein